MNGFAFCALTARLCSVPPSLEASLGSAKARKPSVRRAGISPSPDATGEGVPVEAPPGSPGKAGLLERGLGVPRRSASPPCRVSDVRTEEREPDALERSWPCLLRGAAAAPRCRASLPRRLAAFEVPDPLPLRSPRGPWPGALTSTSGRASF